MADKPYRGVSAGGNVFDSQKVQYSAGTQNLLKSKCLRVLSYFSPNKINESEAEAINANLVIKFRF